MRLVASCLAFIIAQRRAAEDLEKFFVRASTNPSTSVAQDCNDWAEDRRDPYELSDAVVGVDTADKVVEAIAVSLILTAGGCRLVTGFLGTVLEFICFSGDTLTWRVIEIGLETSRCFFGFKAKVVGLFAGMAVFFTGGRAVGLAVWVIERVLVVFVVDRRLGLAAKESGIGGTGGCFIGDDGLDLEALIADAGRRGGRIGLVASALKKLEVRLVEEGEGGICERVSIVLSDKDGRGFRFTFGVSGGMSAGSDKVVLICLVGSHNDEDVFCGEASPEVPLTSPSDNRERPKVPCSSATLGSCVEILFPLLKDVGCFPPSMVVPGRLCCLWRIALPVPQAIDGTIDCLSVLSNSLRDSWEIGSLDMRGMPDGGFAPFSILLSVNQVVNFEDGFVGRSRKIHWLS